MNSLHGVVDIADVVLHIDLQQHNLMGIVLVRDLQALEISCYCGMACWQVPCGDHTSPDEVTRDLYLFIHSVFCLKCIVHTS